MQSAIHSSHYGTLQLESPSYHRTGRWSGAQHLGMPTEIFSLEHNHTPPGLPTAKPRHGVTPSHALNLGWTVDSCCTATVIHSQLWPSS